MLDREQPSYERIEVRGCRIDKVFLAVQLLGAGLKLTHQSFETAEMTLRAFRRLQRAQAIREFDENLAHRIMRDAGAMRVEGAGLQEEQQTRHLAKTAFHRVVDRAQGREIRSDAFVVVADGYEMIRP